MISKDMNILICKSDTFGGANYLLDRLYKWLRDNNYNVEQSILSKNIIPHKGIYDIAILPSYIYDDIHSLSHKGIIVKSILLWIMGMGCFQDGYYNPANKRGLKGFFTSILAKEAESALRDVTNHRSICFTDVVGRYNTYKDEKYADEHYENNSLIPIGISVSDYSEPENRHEKMNVCWVGRVTHDFKFVPLKQALTDIDIYHRANDVNMCFTIVGDGDAVADIKQIANTLSFEVKFIPFLQYDNLDEFFSKQDLTFAMGTSALDAARNSCPAVVVTPVREGIDEEKVFYRWIFESKGYSLGEYPGWDEKTKQVRKQLIEIMEEFSLDSSLSRRCWEYTMQFDENVAFKKLLDCSPLIMKTSLLNHIKKFYYIRKMIKMYSKIKKMVSTYRRRKRITI